ncbi:DUF6339 family protein [Dactylosporangium sp. NPDC050688]|uniref:DUF6339 family protein n=1 Tax=Dactylosporangium sp. NPDC050688 TaxID=3157217 RepID=UPI0033D5EC32
MSTLYPRIPDRVAKERYEEIRQAQPQQLEGASAASHPAQYYAATGGVRVHVEQLRALREEVRTVAVGLGFPDRPLGRELGRFDTTVARVLHAHMGAVPAEAAVRPVWAFMALILLPDIAVWRFPAPTGDRVLATDITRHVFGRLWWRAELLRDDAESTDPYHLIDVFSERNFDQIFARRRSVGGSPELVRALAKEWLKRDLMTRNETEILRDVLKHLMRRGAFQDLFGLPEPLLREEVAAVITEAKENRERMSHVGQPDGRAQAADSVDHR